MTRNVIRVALLVIKPCLNTGYTQVGTKSCSISLGNVPILVTIDDMRAYPSCCQFALARRSHSDGRLGRPHTMPMLGAPDTRYIPKPKGRLIN